MVPIQTAGLFPDVRSDVEPQKSVDTIDVTSQNCNYVLLNDSVSSSQQTHCDSIIKKKFFWKKKITWFILENITTYKGSFFRVVYEADGNRKSFPVRSSFSKPGTQLSQNELS